MRRALSPFFPLVLGAAVLLAGCDLLGIDSPEKIAALKEAEGKATGSACRHAGRAIEDCYAKNPKAQRAAVFAGWREMDEYMRENKLEAVLPADASATAAAPEADEPAEPAKPEKAGKADKAGKPNRT